MNPSRRYDEKDGQWYCIDCKGWGGMITKEPTPPRCYPNHRIIRVYKEGKK